VREDGRLEFVHADSGDRAAGVEGGFLQPAGSDVLEMGCRFIIGHKKLLVES